MKKKILIGLCIFFIILLAGGYIFLRSPLFTERLRLLMESTIAKRLEREASVGKVSGNVFGNISISNISIAKDNKLSNGKLLEVDEVAASYSLIKLLRGKFAIQSLRINKPRLWLELNEEGELNLPRFAAAKKEEKKSRFSVIISYADIYSGEVVFDDKKGSIHLAVSGIDGEIEGAGGQMDFSGNIRAQKMQIDARGFTKTASNVDSTFETQAGGLNISDLRLQLGRSDLQAKAGITAGDAPQINAEIRSKLFLSDVRDLLPQLDRLDGVAEVSAVVSGKTSDPVGVCKIVVSTMYINDLEARNLRAEARYSQNTINLTDFSANLTGGSTKLKGVIKLAAGKLSKYEGSLKLNNVEIGGIIAALNKSDAPVSGYLSGDVSLSGTDFRPGNMDIDGSFSIENTRWKRRKSGIASVGTVKALLSVEGETIGLDVSRDETTLGLKGRLGDDGKLDLLMAVDEFDLEEISSLLTGTPSIAGNGHLKAEASMKIANSGFRKRIGLAPVSSRSDLIEGIADLQARVNLNIPDMRLETRDMRHETRPRPLPIGDESPPVSSLKSVHLGSLTGTINLINDRLKVDEIVLQLDESKLRVTADVQIEDSPSIDARLTADSLKIENYTHLMGTSPTYSPTQSLPLSGGLVNGELEIHGKFKDINGSGGFSVKDLLVGDRKIDLIDIPIDIRSSTVNIPNLTVTSAGEQFVATCSISQSGNYNLQLGSSLIDLAKLVPDSLPISGTAQISVSGSGSISSPSLEGKLDLRQLGYNGESFGNGACTFDLKDERVHVNASLSDQTLIAILDAGIKHPFPYRAIVQLGNISLEPVLKFEGIGEKMDLHIAGSIDVDGEGANPMKSSAEAVLQTVILDLQDRRWTNDLPVKFWFNDGKLQLDSLRMKNSGGQFSVYGTFDTSGVVDLNMAVDDFDFAVISDTLNLKPVKGKLDYTLKLSGDISSPTLEMELDASDVAYEQVDINRILSRVTYKKGVLEVERLTLNALNGDARIKAAIPLDLDLKNMPTLDQLMEKSLFATVDAEGLDLSLIPSLAPQVMSAGGAIGDVHLEVTGPLKQPEITGLLKVKDAHFQIKSLPASINNINGTLSIQSLKPGELPSQYEASMDFGWEIEGGRYDAKGSVLIPRKFLYSKLIPIVQDVSSHMTETGEPKPYFQLDLGIRNGKLGPFLKGTHPSIPSQEGIGKYKLPPIDGNFTGTLHLDGQLPHTREVSSKTPLALLDDLRGGIIIDSLNVTVNDYQVKNSDRITVSFANRILELPGFQFLTLAPIVNKVEAATVPSIQVGSITGSGRINADETFQLALSGEHLHPGLFTSLLTPPKSTSGNPPPNPLPGGDLTFDIHAGGKFDSPAISLSLTAENLSLPVASADGEMRVDGMICKMSYADKILNVEEIQVQSFGNLMNVNGTLPVNLSLMPPAVEFSDQEMDLRMVMRNFDLAFLSHLMKNIQEVKGNAEADVKMCGTLEDPRLTGSFQLLNAGCRLKIDSSKLAQASVVGQEIPKQPDVAETRTTVKPETRSTDEIGIENVNLKLSMGEEGIVMDSMSFQVGEGKYEAHGKLELGKRLEPQQFDIAFAASPAKIDPYVGLAGQDLSGEIMISGQLSGNIRELRGKSILDKLRTISGEMLIPGEGIKINAAKHIITNPDQIHAKLQQGKLNLDSLKVIDKTGKEGQSSSISAFGEWNIDGEKFFDATVNLDMGLVSELMHHRDFMNGWLAFKVQARGQKVQCFWPPENLPYVQGLTVGHATVDRFEGNVTYQDQEILVEKIRISSGENHVIFSGKVPMTGKKMDLRLVARLDDMGILSLINKDITESSGTGIIGATITGDMKKVIAREEPARFLGSCRFDNLNVNFGRSYIDFEDVKTDLVFDSQPADSKKGFIELKAFRGKMNGGEFALDLSQPIKPSAEIKWDKETSYRIGEIRDIAITMKDCKFFQPMVFSVTFDGDLSLKGKFDAPILKGNVVVKEGEYTESLESFIQKLFASREIGVKAFLDYPLVQDLELDVNVQVPGEAGKVRMKNALVYAEAKAAARVRGSLTKPIVLAQASVLEGSSFSYFGRKFAITKGEIRNENEIDPKYEITAETDIKNTLDTNAQNSTLTVQMELKGSLNEPSMPNFKVSGGGVAQGRTNLSQSDIISILTLGTTPEAFLSGGISGSSPFLMESAKWLLQSKAQERFNLKEFQLQLDLNNTRETRLVVAKQLMEQISFLMDVSYGEQQIGLEYEMTKYLAFAGKVSQKGDWDLDLKIKRDFP